MSAENPVTEAEAIIDSAITATTPYELCPGVTAFRLAQDSRVELVAHERYAGRPDRKRGTVTVNDVDSLRRYLDEQAGAASTVWVDIQAATLTAVIDDHEQGAEGEEVAGWGEHRALLRLIPTPEWAAWTAVDGHPISQEDFADLIEERLADIAVPAGAELLEIAQTLHATTTATFKGSVRLATGASTVSYAEEVETAAGANRELVVPEKFTVAISPYYGEPRVYLDARLRLRVREGKLTKVKLNDPEKVRLDSLKELVERLRAEYPRTFAGRPRDSGTAAR